MSNPTLVLALTADEIRTVRTAIARLYKHEAAKMRRMRKKNHPQVAGQAMWMADIKQLFDKVGEP